MKAKTRRWPQCVLLPIVLFLLTFLFCCLQFIEYEYADFESHNQTLVMFPSAVERVPVADVLAVREFIESAPNRAHSNAWQYYHYNVRRSDVIGAFRALPDTRDASCTARPYHLTAAQRSHSRVSVIITFHNEARSALVRTIMALYLRTPSRHLYELILIDDCSDDADLLHALIRLKLPPFMRNFSSSAAYSKSYRPTPTAPVTIKTARNMRRTGVIASRNRGARLATGDYLLFLDSHCEVNVGWLEPLLERLGAAGDDGGDGAVAVSPVLDSIDSESLEYAASSKNLMGGFDWNLHFHWIPRPQLQQQQQQQQQQTVEQQRQQQSAERLNADLWEDGGQRKRFSEAQIRRDINTNATAFKSPTFAGGIFIISRVWFFKLKGFNSQLETWGGESIEFSIKLWLCGGKIEIVPCSRVGHIFRKEHPFRFPNGNDGQTTYLRNSKIIAESWLDAYKYFFYASKPAAKHIAVNFTAAQQLNNQQLKSELNCRSFSWYLLHVFPQLKLPNDDFIAFGTLSSAELCLQITNVTPNSAIANPLHMTSCFRSDVTHWYLHRKDSQLQVSSGACLSVVQMLHNSSLMLTSSMRASHFRVVLQPCAAEDGGEDDGGATGHNQRQNQRWLRRGGSLVHQKTQLCLDNPLSDVVVVSHCRNAAPSQLFRFTMELQRL